MTDTTEFREKEHIAYQASGMQYRINSIVAQP